ncbi:MAG: hypothetical protein RL120_08460 [Gammaproteobacteria bacterium]
MTDLAVGAQPGISFKPGFYFWMSLAMFATIFGGFGLSYFLPMASDTLRPVSPIVHVHGIFYFSWMILLVAQSGLVSSGNIALHRTMGTAGVSVATGLVIFATVITVLNIGASLELEVSPFLFELMYISLLAISIFAVLFIFAIRNTRKPEYHRRFIMLATIGFLGAGINRFYIFIFSVEFAPFWALYAIADLFILAMLIHDWRKDGKIHPATATGGLINVIPQLLHVPIATSAAFESVTFWLVGLSGYAIIAPPGA